MFLHICGCKWFHMLCADLHHIFSVPPPFGPRCVRCLVSVLQDSLRNLSTAQGLCLPLDLMRHRPGGPMFHCTPLGAMCRVRCISAGIAVPGVQGGTERGALGSASPSIVVATQATDAGRPTGTIQAHCSQARESVPLRPWDPRLSRAPGLPRLPPGRTSLTGGLPVGRNGCRHPLASSRSSSVIQPHSSLPISSAWWWHEAPATVQPAWTRPRFLRISMPHWLRVQCAGRQSSRAAEAHRLPSLHERLGSLTHLPLNFAGDDLEPTPDSTLDFGLHIQPLRSFT